jgi:hypothetical protein
MTEINSSEQSTNFVTEQSTNFVTEQSTNSAIEQITEMSSAVNQMTDETFKCLLHSVNHFKILLKILKEIVHNDNLHLNFKFEEDDQCIIMFELNESKTILFKIKWKLSYSSDIVHRPKINEKNKSIKISDCISILDKLDEEDELCFYTKPSDDDLYVKNENYGDEHKLTNYRLEHYTLPLHAKFDYLAIVNSSTFFNCIKEINKLDEYVQIETTSDNITFKTIDNTYKETIDASISHHSLIKNLTVTNIYSTKNLLLLRNIKKLINNIDIFIASDFPLTIRMTSIEFTMYCLFTPVQMNEND